MSKVHDIVTILRWKVEKAVTRKFNLYRSFRTAKRKILIISLDHRIPQSQIFPFRYFGPEIDAKWSVEIREVRLALYQQNPTIFPGGADIVLLQTWFDIDKNELKSLLVKIRDLNPNAKLVFLDSFAPTDLRLASSVNDYIDLYISKHVLRNREDYFKPTMGDTQLVEYYSKYYKLNTGEVFFEIPDDFLDKLVVGPSFFTSPNMLPYFLNQKKKMNVEKKYDVHGRLGFDGAPWYRAMRMDAISRMESMTDLSILSTLGVSNRKYFRELQKSKICFSPFGYGEVCWRDYEAVLCGSLLLKPDMSHVETYPNIFQPDITYVPLKWDFSDLEEKVRYYLEHPVEREAIADRAYTVLHEYCVNNLFVKQHQSILAN